MAEIFLGLEAVGNNEFNLTNYMRNPFLDPDQWKQMKRISMIRITLHVRHFLIRSAR